MTFSLWERMVNLPLFYHPKAGIYHLLPVQSASQPHRKTGEKIYR
jgi:hypothetical protein